jgi:hypothetical protein
MLWLIFNDFGYNVNHVNFEKKKKKAKRNIPSLKTLVSNEK